jgi:hypothetical protein
LSKIVITLKGPKAVIGVQAEGCDPYTDTADLTIGDRDIVDVLRSVINSALVQWETARTYPKFAGTLPSQVKVPTRLTTPSPVETPRRHTTASPTAKPAEPARPLQGSMF